MFSNLHLTLRGERVGTRMRGGGLPALSTACLL